jgi:hypothetical protein
MEALCGRRDLIILSILYRADLRRSELASLDLAHVTGDRLIIFGKREAAENRQSGTGGGNCPLGDKGLLFRIRRPNHSQGYARGQ